MRSFRWNRSRCLIYKYEFFVFRNQTILMNENFRLLRFAFLAKVYFSISSLFKCWLFIWVCSSNDYCLFHLLRVLFSLFKLWFLWFFPSFKVSLMGTSSGLVCFSWLGYFILFCFSWSLYLVGVFYLSLRLLVGRSFPWCRLKGQDWLWVP